MKDSALEYCKLCKEFYRVHYDSDSGSIDYVEDCKCEKEPIPRINKEEIDKIAKELYDKFILSGTSVSRDATGGKGKT